MSGDGYLLSEATVRKLADHVRRLSHQVQGLEGRLAATYNPPDFGRELWCGVTAARSGETYPDPPNNVYTVRLASRVFDPESRGEQDADANASDPGEYVAARTITGVNLPEGSPVVVEKHSSAAGIRWWIRPPQSTIRRATASASIAAGSSGNAAIKVSGLSDETVEVHYDWADDGLPTIDNGDEIFVVWDEEQKKWVVIPVVAGSGGTTIPTAILFNGNAYNGDSSNKNRLKYYAAGDSRNRSCYIHFINGWGELSTTGVDVMATASSVGAGTHAHTDPSFKLTQGGLYRFLVHFQNEDTTTLPAYTTNTITTSGASAGTAHTHTVDVRQEHGYRSQTRVMLQWRNTGGGAWQTTEFQMTANGSRMDHSTDSGTDDTPDEDTFECEFWQNHNQVDREYRIKIDLGGSFDSATAFLQRDIYADSGLIAITRLGDYAADQTLTP